MERRYETVDKSEWGPGPWQDEPDKIQFKDESTGYPCLVKRGPLGALCGYVGVTEDHPAFGLHYDAIHGLFGDWDSDSYLDVHGGLTYADSCQEGPEELAICHIPDPGESDHVWWVGFDCGHAWDVMPRMEADYRKRFKETGDPLWLSLDSHRETPDRSYKNIEFVRTQCKELARQLATLER